MAMHISGFMLPFACWIILRMHDDVIKWKHFPRFWSFVQGIHRSPVTRGFYVFFDLRRINGWVNNCEAGDLRRIRPHYNVTVMDHMYWYVWLKNCCEKYHVIYRAGSRLAPSQWETSLQSNAVSRWMGANLESVLIYFVSVIPVF